MTSADATPVAVAALTLVAWAPYQRRAIDCISRRTGITSRPACLPHRKSRYNTARLASRLTRALRTRTS
jgi:hypothetical protein